MQKQYSDVESARGAITCDVGCWHAPGPARLAILKSTSAFQSSRIGPGVRSRVGHRARRDRACFEVRCGGSGEMRLAQSLEIGCLRPARCSTSVRCCEWLTWKVVFVANSNGRACRMRCTMTVAVPQLDWKPSPPCPYACSTRRCPFPATEDTLPELHSLSTSTRRSDERAGRRPTE
jgi:hypothetical protein